MATIETIPLIFLFVFMLCYTLGFFGIIHTAILHSISARSYAFETFRNRTNVVYFRDIDGADQRQYSTAGQRLHTITSEQREDGDSRFIPSERALRMGMVMKNSSGRTVANHNEAIPQDTNSLGLNKRNTNLNASPVWIMVQYGICLDNKCGD